MTDHHGDPFPKFNDLSKFSVQRPVTPSPDSRWNDAYIRAVRLSPFHSVSSLEATPIGISTVSKYSHDDANRRSKIFTEICKNAWPFAKQ